MAASYCSCSHWWHAPFYIAATIALLVAAFSSPPPSSSSSSSSFTTTTTAAAAAAVALHRSGFHLTAAILQVSPVSIFPLSSSSISSSATTLFVVPDDAISNLSLLHHYSSVSKQLFRSHTVPIPLPFQHLLRKPNRTRFPTLLPDHNLHLQLVAANRSSVVVAGRKHGSVLINNVAITHPDLFVSRSRVIHGVATPLYDDFRSCSSGDPRVAVVPWDRVVRVLSSRGFASFAVGINSVLDVLVRMANYSRGGGGGGGGVTVFAPRDEGFDYVASSKPLLERAVRRHVAVGLFLYRQITAMGLSGEGLKTLDGDGDIRITGGESTGTTAAVAAVSVNGVEITEPDLYEEVGFVVHGVARALQPVQQPST